MKEEINNKAETQSRWETELSQRVDSIEEEASSIQAMTKKDYIVAAVITIACLIAVVGGAFLG